MTIPIGSSLPPTVISGDVYKWRVSQGTYVDPTWTLKYEIHSGASTPVKVTIDGADIVVEASTATWLVTLSATKSASLTKGWWAVFGFVSRSAPTERTTLRRSQITVEPDPATAADYRSHLRLVLDALDATILGKADHDQASYSIAGRALSEHTPDDLLKWRAHYKGLLAAEDAAELLAAGKSPGKLVKVEFPVRS